MLSQATICFTFNNISDKNTKLLINFFFKLKENCRFCIVYVGCKNHMLFLCKPFTKCNSCIKIFKIKTTLDLSGNKLSMVDTYSFF